MDFFLNFLGYLVAFVLGGGLAFLAARRIVPATSRDQALAELDGARGDGADR
jgi:hypothetical protein